MLPSNFADLSNISNGDYTPGASTAAAFLSYFVEGYQKVGYTSIVQPRIASQPAINGLQEPRAWA